MADLSQPMTRTRTTREFNAIAEDLQGNILRGHGRKFAHHILIRFRMLGTGTGNPAAGDDEEAQALASLTAAREFVTSKIADAVTNAGEHEHLAENEDYVCFGLSAAGYRTLRLDPPRSDAAFAEGLQKRASDVFASMISRRDNVLERQWHAILIVANNNKDALDVASERWSADLQAVADTEILSGAMLPGATEHFGFEDGISTPVLLLDGPPRTGVHWNPIFPLDQALIKDDGGIHDENSLGSFLVFVKFQQNVARFRKVFPSVAEQVRAVGRQKDGEAAAVQVAPETRNDFVFVDDDADPNANPGGMCPLSSHIRKANPRRPEDPQRPEESDRRAQIVRRGIPYGPAFDEDPDNTDRGLLFMAYNRSIDHQFEVMQRDWIGASDFPKTGTDELAGKDALLTGNGSVEFCGGEYFFAPCISMLRTITKQTTQRKGNPMAENTDWPTKEGRGMIVPSDEWIGELFEKAKSEKAEYWPLANEASMLGPAGGREKVKEWLGHRDVDLLTGLDAAELSPDAKEELLETLRIMGISLRRMAMMDAEEGLHPFDAVIDQMIAAGPRATW